jgi:anti-sigma B factor antagonist
MSLEFATVNDMTVVKLRGEFDAAAADLVRDEMEALVSSGDRRLVLDLTDVSFVDSTGMGLIIYAFKRLQSGGGDFRVAGATGQPRELFKLLRVDRVMRLFPDISSATANG